VPSACQARPRAAGSHAGAIAAIIDGQSMGGASTTVAVIGVPLVLLAGVLWTIRYWARERRKVWGAVAGSLGVSFRPSLGTPVLTGTYRGRVLRFDHVSHRGRSAQTRVVVALGRRPGGVLSISPQAAPINIIAAKLFGAHDVELGDPAFDARFTVKSEPPAFARGVLADTGLRQKLLAERVPFLVELDGQAVRLLIADCCETGVDHMRHVAVDGERVRALLDLACDLATALDARGDPSGATASASPDLARVARRTTSSYAGAALSALLALFMTYVIVAQWSAARRWRSVDAVIAKSEVAPGNRPEVIYRYTVGGATYESPFYAHLPDGLDEEHARAIVNSHPLGARLTVYYDVTRPSHGGLDRPKSPPITLVLPAVWAVCGALLFFSLRGT